ncbi:peptidoglycan recognition protein family protein [Candidatus Clostridium radicumherbarum]|uniref:N-acetylmuramoyl-L-alanine amidase n=1 Tax=Candidatus Clostridium radicumherbarum TaxID=3381662 RepID=A0ABW8TNF7_9CLOT
MAYTINQRFISMNRSNIQLKPIGTVVHETSDPGATDENEFNYFNSGNRGASAHAFVDKDSITQTIPWDEQSWHAGPTANTNFIGIELCHYDDAEGFKEVWLRAVWLFAYVHVFIIKRFPITKFNLMSHAEVSEKWHETNHTDPVSYFEKFGKTVDDFRNEVQLEIDKMLNQQLPAAPIENKISNDVLQLQKSLNRLNITDGSSNKLVEDGIQGPKTTEAIKKFQSVAGIKVDGIAGAQTLGAINSIIKKPLLSINSTGVAVRYLQYRLGANIDGIYGPRTRSKVVSYQSSNSLKADGIVGNNTWYRLIG